jgi:aminopeptidase YwaD
MHRLVCVFLLFLFQADVFSQNYPRYILDTLTSEYMAGRGYVEEGSLKAAEFLANQYDSLGLLPFDSTYFQFFPLQVNTFPEGMKVQLDDRVLIPGKDYLVDPSSGGGNGKLEIVEVNVWSKKDMKKGLQRGKWKNKALLIHQPDTLKGEGKQEFKALVASMANQWPIVVVTSEKLTWGVGRQSYRYPLIWVQKEAYEPFKIVSIDIDQKLQTQYVPNVIGYIPASKPSGKFLVITAHYDHLGKMGSETFFPGANDNASGVAQTLSLAAELNQQKQEVNVAFIAFAGEEAGLVGSKYYVMHPSFDLDSIIFVLNLDLSGTGEDGITVVNATVLPDRFELLKTLNEKGKYVKEVKARGPTANSDHYFFSEAGVPAFFIYTRGGIQAYHDIYDRAETLPLTKTKELTDLYLDFLQALLEME